ncbi:hypothetical protein SAMN04488085_10924 [Geodermatophilus ruber]|uniref:Uncharacterized protein n=1 Tax=Geodermatophilus ruber TaxID=504800 RepID=A0A1I4GI78_9ACTN|nr:hypothetical protein SAMN04488085_10924 [Geodermatophilus ruber]
MTTDRQNRVARPDVVPPAGTSEIRRCCTSVSAGCSIRARLGTAVPEDGGRAVSCRLLAVAVRWSRPPGEQCASGQSGPGFGQVGPLRTSVGRLLGVGHARRSADDGVHGQLVLRGQLPPGRGYAGLQLRDTPDAGDDRADERVRQQPGDRQLGQQRPGARPMNSSDRPCPYAFAVSTKLTPRSSAAWTTRRVRCSSSRGGPKVLPPSPTTERCRSEAPSCRRASSVAVVMSATFPRSGSTTPMSSMNSFSGPGRRRNRRASCAGPSGCGPSAVRAGCPHPPVWSGRVAEVPPQQERPDSLPTRTRILRPGGRRGSPGRCRRSCPPDRRPGRGGRPRAGSSGRRCRTARRRPRRGGEGWSRPRRSPASPSPGRPARGGPAAGGPGRRRPNGSTGWHAGPPGSMASTETRRHRGDRPR